MLKLSEKHTGSNQPNHCQGSNNMKLNDAQKAAIRTAAFTAVAEALENMDAGVTRTNLYDEALSQAKIGATQALMQFTGNLKSRAADLGGLNRSTLRTNLGRIS